MVRVRMYLNNRIAKEKFLEYCEYNIGNIKMKRFNVRGSGVPVVLLKNNDFVLFMSCQVYAVWCIGRTYYDDLEQCYRRSGFKISKELAEQIENI
jgi:hypothetical protein